MTYLNNFCFVSGGLLFVWGFLLFSFPCIQWDLLSPVTLGCNVFLCGQPSTPNSLQVITDIFMIFKVLGRYLLYLNILPPPNMHIHCPLLCLQFSHWKSIQFSLFSNKYTFHRLLRVILFDIRVTKITIACNLTSTNCAPSTELSVLELYILSFHPYNTMMR